MTIQVQLEECLAYSKSSRNDKKCFWEKEKLHLNRLKRVTSTLGFSSALVAGIVLGVRNIRPRSESMFGLISPNQSHGCAVGTAVMAESSVAPVTCLLIEVS